MRIPHLVAASFLALLPATAYPLQDPSPGGESAPAVEPDQDSAGDPEEAEPEVEAIQDDEAQTLVSLSEQIRTSQAKLEEARDGLTGAPDPTARAELESQIQELSDELASQRQDLRSVSTGMDAPDLDEEQRKFDLTQELEELVRPLLEELKDATEGPRTIENLRTQEAYASAQVERRTASIRNLKAKRDLLEAERTELPNRSLSAGDLATAEAKLTDSIADLNDLQSDLEQEKREYETAQKVADSQLRSKLASQTSVIESSRAFFSTFFRTRGLNLALALLAFVVVFFGLRWTYRFVSKAFPQRSAHRPMHRRLIEVVVHTFAGVAALGASLIVLSAAGDWVLLGLVLLLIAGVAWASKMAIPRYLAEMRLLLNLGTVREAERVVYNGLPYRVARLGIQTHLTNPALEGGYMRLPVGDLIDMRSRPIAPGDLWFPCRLGDYVLLSDGQRGEVVKLTPELVRIALLGGSEVTYTTSDFLGLSPENISRDFRLFVTFGIDYEHQAIATTEVAPKMHAALQAGLSGIVGENDINSLKVEFKEAAASSLDYAIMIDFSGDVAARYAMLNRTIQRILVDLCNQEGWVIPFTQIVVHQAD